MSGGRWGGWGGFFFCTNSERPRTPTMNNVDTRTQRNTHPSTRTLPALHRHLVPAGRDSASARFVRCVHVCACVCACTYIHARRIRARTSVHTSARTHTKPAYVRIHTQIYTRQTGLTSEPPPTRLLLSRPQSSFRQGGLCVCVRARVRVCVVVVAGRGAQVEVCVCACARARMRVYKAEVPTRTGWCPHTHAQAPTHPRTLGGQSETPYVRSVCTIPIPAWRAGEAQTNLM